ncbi:MAG: hypothetical protein AMJ60_00705 [Desulfobacterales bacterium SG8_35]|nr:MAG: hypothetical protein AMJ60_00705 [Desulfobacterales bacterium SG8_35]
MSLAPACTLKPVSVCIFKKGGRGEFREKLAAQAVLNIGCGSGILTIAALRLGTARALAIKIDPEAVSGAPAEIYN